MSDKPEAQSAASSSASSTSTRVERQRGVVVVHVEARNLDDENTRRVHADIAAAVAESPAAPFVLDLAKVKFLPSLTLREMVRLGNEFRARGQRLLLASLQPTVRQVLTITRLDHVFEIHDDVEQAIAAAARATDAGR